MEVSVVFGLPPSFSQPARQTRPRAASVRTTMSASISCTSWNEAIGRPNCSRSLAYATEASTHPWQMPTHPAATLKRPESSAVMAILNPSPTSPSSASSPTSTPSSDSSAVSEARSPSLPWISWEENPSERVGTRKHAMPRWPCSGSVWANTSATSA
jgi:hypothetical protein